VLGSAPILDKDLETTSRDQLIEEVKRLRAGIREHRDSNIDNCEWGRGPELSKASAPEPKL
jgi:hypothetical protein